MSSQAVVYARRPFDYNDLSLDMQQVFSLQGARNDEKLLGLGYVEKVSQGVSIVSCGRCGAKFITDSALQMHGRKRHSGRTLTPQQEDDAAEAEMKRANDIAPLYLEKTEASRKGSARKVNRK